MRSAIIFPWLLLALLLSCCLARDASSYLDRLLGDKSATCAASTPSKPTRGTATDKSHKLPSGLSPIYSSLPKNAEQYKVRNVYDGDTLTLVDKRRVRLLGIDTPELKPKQPFGDEAKEYTKSYCHKKDIWLSYDGERKDHYGRLLAFIWVQLGPQQYLCINEGIVAEGLASAYIPNKRSRPLNFSKLLKLQKYARLAKKGIWGDFDDKLRVYKTANGAAYHKRSCPHMQNMRSLSELKAGDAVDKGLHACRTCFE